MPYKHPLVYQHPSTIKPLYIDGELCLTPERKYKSSQDRNKDLKVTFDSAIDICQLSPNVSEDTEITDIEACDVSQLKEYNHQSYIEEFSDEEHYKTSDDAPRLEKVVLEEVQSRQHVVDETLHHLLHLPSSVHQKPTEQLSEASSLSNTEQSDCYPGIPKTTILSRSGTSTEEEEHAFTRPEFNSTLKVSSELQRVKDSELNLKEAVTNKLKCSAQTRTKITEKVSICIEKILHILIHTHTHTQTHIHTHTHIYTVLSRL